MAAVVILTKNEKQIASLNDCHHPTVSILPNKTANIIKQTANIKVLSANYKHRS